ncbi:hypothetical protein [Zavarzinella formosa]|uniref:hypothetical protein n=1 Tax=Zavarzinella formosa TaxID=360055 RepID=UPI0002EC0814|nr:hypothetical protein [Zavarzinella formosa]
MPSSNVKIGLLAFGIVGGLGAVLVIGLAVLLMARRAPDQEHAGTTSEAKPDAGWLAPAAANEGEKWTIRELADYLQNKKALPEGVEVSLGNRFGTPVGRLKDTLDVLDFEQLENNKKAREIAAANNREAALSWGRFSLKGDRLIVERIHKALSGGELKLNPGGWNRPMIDPVITVKIKMLGGWEEAKVFAKDNHINEEIRRNAVLLMGISGNRVVKCLFEVGTLDNSPKAGDTVRIYGRIIEKTDGEASLIKCLIYTGR